MSDADIGFGSRLGKGNGAAPEVFAWLSEITDLKAPNLSRGTSEVTHMESPGRWREYIPTLKEGGEITVEMNFVPGGPSMVIIMAEFATNEVGKWQMEFADGSTFTAFLICTDFSPGVPMDEKMPASASFKVSGEPVFVDAS